MKKIKVGIDARYLTKGDSFRGIGVHTQELVNELKKLGGLTVEVLTPVKSEKDFDLIHYPKFYPYFLNFPVIKKGKSVLTIHDLIPLIYPKQYPPGIKGKVRFYLQKILVSKMDAIITISHTSKKDICRFLNINPQKVYVIYLAPKKIFKPVKEEKLFRGTKEKYALPEKYVLYVGDVNYNKNLTNLAKACGILKIPLLIVGKQAVSKDFNGDHPENKSWADFLNRYGGDKNVIRIGYLKDEDLVNIYNLATVYCQPSFYEGFGLPLLEAFASGVPVVASRINTHVEIAGDAAVFADPKNPQDIAEKIEKLIRDEGLRNEMVKKGFEKVKGYTWKKTAEETFKVYKKVITLSNGCK